jgi:hypothetical protein
MQRSKKSDECCRSLAYFLGVTFWQQSARGCASNVASCSGTQVHYAHGRNLRVKKSMAFVRRKGNAYYLVHNVRRGGKVRQLHLARLGDRARITDQVVREVSKRHPFVDLNWRNLREQLNNHVDLADPDSPAVQKLIASLRTLNLDLADLFPPILRISESRAVAHELLVQLRLVQSTIQVKLAQFDQGRGRFSTASGHLRRTLGRRS